MGIFSGITKAFHSVSDAITGAYDSFSESMHDVFYSPKEYISDEITVKPTKDIQYEEWLIEQSLVDMGTWSFFHDIFDDKIGTP
jgi:hypothetical protein